MSTRRNIIANYLGQGFASLLGLALVPVYINYLSIEAYALVGLFATVQVWLSLLDLGMTPTLGREMARYSAGAVSVQFIRDLLRSLEITVASLAVLIAAGLTLASGWLATDWLRVGALGTDTVASALSLIGVVVALRFSESIYRSAIMGLGQQVWLNGATVLLSMLRGFGAVAVLGLVSTTIEAFFIWQGLVSLTTLAAFGAKLHLALPRAPRRPRFSLDALVEVRGFAGGVFGMSLLALILTQIDKLMLSRLLPLADFGYYMLASALTGALYLVVMPILQAVYPSFVRLVVSGDQRLLSDTYHRTAQLVSVLLIPATLGLVLFAQPILYVWSGDLRLAARTAPMLALLAVGTLLNALMQVPHQLQLASGWTSLALRTNVVAVTLLVPALLLLVPRYGGVAAAAIWAVLNAGYVVVVVPLMHRRLLRGEAVRWYVDDIVRPGGAAALIFGSAWLLLRDASLDRLEWSSILALTGIVSLAAASLAATTVRMQMITALAEIQRRTRLRSRPPGATPR